MLEFFVSVGIPEEEMLVYLFKEKAVTYIEKLYAIENTRRNKLIDELKEAFKNVKPRRM